MLTLQPFFSYGERWKHLYSTTSGMCIQFISMPPKWQNKDYPCSGGKRISATKYRIWFQILLTITGKWTESCMSQVWRWDRINPVHLSSCPHAFQSLLAQQHIPSIYFCSHHGVVIEETYGEGLRVRVKRALQCIYPAGTRRLYNVELTSLQRIIVRTLHRR